MQRYQLEVAGSVDCLAKITVILGEQGIGGYDAPHFRDGRGTIKFESVAEPDLAAAKNLVGSERCATAMNVRDAPPRM